MWEDHQGSATLTSDCEQTHWQCECKWDRSFNFWICNWCGIRIAGRISLVPVYVQTQLEIHMGNQLHLILNTVTVSHKPSFCACYMFNFKSFSFFQELFHSEQRKSIHWKKLITFKEWVVLNMSQEMHNYWITHYKWKKMKS